MLTLTLYLSIAHTQAHIHVLKFNESSNQNQRETKISSEETTNQQNTRHSAIFSSAMPSRWH